MQRNGDAHAAVKIGHDGVEHGRVFQPADGRHFGQVLVCLAEGVAARAVQPRRAVLCFIFGDHLFAAAAVPRHRMAGKGIIGRGDAARDQRIDEGNEAARMAARHRDAGRRRDGGAVFLRKLGKAVRPARRRAVGCGCVDDAHVPVAAGTKIRCPPR